MTVLDNLPSSPLIDAISDIVIDPSDGLPVMKVGSWAAEKHQLLQAYVAASYGVRMKYKESTLIDLYCGPGKVFDKDSPGIFRDNGVVAAYKKSCEGKNSNGRYRTVIIGDVDKSSLEACKVRLQQLGANVIALHGPSHETVSEAVHCCPKYGLKLAYLDPFRPQDLPFSVLRQLSHIPMIDFIVYYGQMDITRNIDSEFQRVESRFDEFAPGWKQHIDVNAVRKEHARTLFLDYWLSLMENLGFRNAKVKPLLKVDINNAPLYRMILFSGHALAPKLWDSVAQSPQGSFNF